MKLPKQGSHVWFRNQGDEILSGRVNGKPYRVALDEGVAYYIPVWVSDRATTIYVHSANLVPFACVVDESGGLA